MVVRAESHDHIITVTSKRLCVARRNRLQHTLSLRGPIYSKDFFRKIQFLLDRPDLVVILRRPNECRIADCNPADRDRPVFRNDCFKMNNTVYADG